jgi:hypothetical protein
MRCARVVALVACRVLLVVVGSSWDEVGKKVQHLDVRAEVPASVACLCFARELALFSLGKGPATTFLMRLRPELVSPIQSTLKF